MIKIKVNCNWSSSEDLLKRLLTQFKTSDHDLEGIEFVIDGGYDCHVIFGFINCEIDSSKPTFLFPQEPSWSGGHQKQFHSFPGIKVFGFDKYNYSPVESVVESIAYMFYGGRGPWEEGYDNWCYDNIINSGFVKTKNVCSFISNNGINEVSHLSGCLYGERVSLVKSLSQKTEYIDFYGWGDKGNLKPFARKKYDAIKEYKFCLTVENSHEKYYLSEKFYDCILTNTVPIYYGCSNIKEYWPEDGYILLDNITDHVYVQSILEDVIENCDSLYEKMLPVLLKMKKRYFEEFNIIKKIRKELNIL